MLYCGSGKRHSEKALSISEVMTILIHNNEIEFHNWTQPYLQGLAILSRETVDLAVLDGYPVVYPQFC